MVLPADIRQCQEIELKQTDHIPGDFESSKFEHLKGPYYEGLATIKSLGYDFEDLIHYFPAFVGHLTLARNLALYELYKKTLGIVGHIAELGVYKGAGTLLFGKLVQIFEPNSLTQVHGFDWFKGTKPSKTEAEHVPAGGYKESYDRVKTLIDAQGLNHIIKLHNFDLSGSKVRQFFDKYPHLRFKLLFFDAGTYNVVSNALPLFWERLQKRGIIIFDQYNFDIAPGETTAVNEILPDIELLSLPWGWMPTAYAIK